MNFVLPGRIAYPARRTKSLTLSAFAYSRTYNLRNLESYWYGPVSETLTSLVHDLRHAAVIAQPTVWYHDSHTRPRAGRADAENSTQSQNGEGDENAGDESFAFTISFVAPTVTPDFVIYYLRSRYRDPANLPVDPALRQFKDIKMVRAAAPVVIEVKRHCKRAPLVTGTAIPGEEDPQLIRKHVWNAEHQCVKDAPYVFQMYPEQRKIILCAFSGPYWSHRVIWNTGEAPNLTDLPDEDSDSDGEGDEEADEYSEKDAEEPDEESEEELDDEADDDEEDLGDEADEEGDVNLDDYSIAPAAQQLEEEPNLILDDVNWSDFYQLESPQSNRIWYAIHESLGELPSLQGDARWC
ncbi:hypothetical protein FA95DRAFT_1677947 [Auriscalpium vulgare]|uniref:Uncharacterized protein n=1 Tax=Auriscalpium vulgare TaxID=40419 RepID=A0ACB8RY82_9AGAM|nr:hypothetical protein FA95DRAFT_1677947 [Auriscalpium vulgare]